MARALGIREASTVHYWKRTRRIPASWQAIVLHRARELGIEVTAEDVMFPFPEDRQLS